MSMTTDELSFETALDRLEEIVGDLERGDLELSTALSSFERGVGLLARCQALLEGVDRSVALLSGVEPDGTPITTPFDASATATVSVATVVVTSTPSEPAPPKAPPKPRKPKATVDLPPPPSPSSYSMDLGGLNPDDIDPPF